MAGPSNPDRENFGQALASVGCNRTELTSWFRYYDRLGPDRAWTEFNNRCAELADGDFQDFISGAVSNVISHGSLLEEGWWNDIEKGLEETGDAFRYAWKNNITVDEARKR